MGTVVGRGCGCRGGVSLRGTNDLAFCDDPAAIAADVAGLHYRVYNSAVGLNCMLAGYSHKLSVLLSKVLGKMGAAELSAERFVVQKDIVAREYANFFKEQPYQHAMYNASQLLELTKWHILEYLEFTQAGGLTHDAFCVTVAAQ